MPRTATRRQPTAKRGRKNIRIDQDLLDQAKAALTVGRVSADTVITPDAEGWRAAAEALNALGGEGATRGRSFWNDLLIAASCARVGATLVTRNADDFRRIRRVISVAVVPRPA